MAWDYFGLHKQGPQSTQELHINNVYKDPEFQQGVEALFPKNNTVFIEAFRPTTAGTTFVQPARQIKVANHKAYLDLLPLLNIEKRNEVLAWLDPINDKDIEALATKYAIRTNDVWFYLTGSFKTQTAYRTKLPFDIKWDDNDNYTIKFHGDITKEDFLAIWATLERHKRGRHGGKTPRNRLPEHDRLLYAVFKARQRNMSFPAIYDDYKAKKLKYYEGEAPTEFNSPEKFAQYYRDNKPSPSRPI